MSERRWVRKLQRRAPVRGPWFSEILAGIALSYPDCCYVEIGIEHGVTMAVVTACCAEAHGCDIRDRRSAMPKEATFWHMASDEFFQRYDGRSPHLVFIDGLHTYEQARRDYENAAQILAPEGTIALHDTSPGEMSRATPEQCGDVWRFEGEIPGEKFTFRAFPGLTLVRPPRIFPALGDENHSRGTAAT